MGPALPLVPFTAKQGFSWLPVTSLEVRDDQHKPVNQHQLEMQSRRVLGHCGQGPPQPWDSGHTTALRRPQQCTGGVTVLVLLQASGPSVAPAQKPSSSLRAALAHVGCRAIAACGRQERPHADKRLSNNLLCFDTRVTNDSAAPRSFQTGSRSRSGGMLPPSTGHRDPERSSEPSAGAGASSSELLCSRCVSFASPRGALAAP